MARSAPNCHRAQSTLVPALSIFTSGPVFLFTEPTLRITLESRRFSTRFLSIFFVISFWRGFPSPMFFLFRLLPIFLLILGSLLGFISFYFLIYSGSQKRDPRSIRSGCYGGGLAGSSLWEDLDCRISGGRSVTPAAVLEGLARGAQRRTATVPGALWFQCPASSIESRFYVWAGEGAL